MSEENRVLHITTKEWRAKVRYADFTDKYGIQRVKGDKVNLPYTLSQGAYRTYLKECNKQNIDFTMTLKPISEDLSPDERIQLGETNAVAIAAVIPSLQRKWVKDANTLFKENQRREEVRKKRELRRQDIAQITDRVVKEIVKERSAHR